MADYIDSLVLPTSAKLKSGKYSDGDLSRLLKLAERGARDSNAVSAAEFFPVVASANTIDSYGTYMLPSTLKNFAEDATNGVAVLDSHRSDRLNFGMTVTGEYVQDGDVHAFTSDFYTVPGIRTEGLDTDAYIKGVQAGLFRDISVGFYMPPGAMVRCTICGKDMMRWYMEDGCSHFPGMEYDVEADGATRREVAYGAVDGARLSEYSLVYDGATPGAGVAKARSMEDSGALIPEVALSLERQYRTRFPRATHIYRGASLKKESIMTVQKDDREQQAPADGHVEEPEAAVLINEPEAEVTEDATVIAPLITEEPAAAQEPAPEGDDDEAEASIERSKLTLGPKLRDALNERYREQGITFGSRAAEAMTALADALVASRENETALRSQVKALEKDAADGRAYRTSLVDDLKTEIIRANDGDENTEAKVARYMRLAEGADIETIIGLRDDFAEAARKKYGSGRKTIDTAGEAPTQKVEPPVSIYDDIEG